MELIKNIVDRCQSENKYILYAQLRQGGEVSETWQAFPHQTRLNMMSVSKSFVSAGVGIAEAEGLIRLNERICDAFPEYVPADASEYLLNTDLRHMLTMTTGLENSLFFADSPERYRVYDWIDYFFHAKFDHPSGERFRYSNFNTYMLSALIEKRAGVNLLEYLRHRLFEPIGIGNPDWTLCPKGHAYAANGLYLTVDELGRFGQLMLQKGQWEGRTIVPEEYLARASVKQTDITAPGAPEHPLYCGYGYQFWIPRLEGAFEAAGNYGQYCLIWPKEEMVVSVVSLEGNNFDRINEILLEETAKFVDLS